MKYISKMKEYIIRLSKKGLTPHEIALSVALGVFIAAMPFFGIHTIMGIALASLLRVNTLIVLLGTQVSNPLTFPFQLFISAEIGSLILNGKFLKIRFSYDFIELLNHYLLPIILGGLVLGTIGAGISYLLVKGFFKRKQHETA
jgi:uncharacterized protein